VGVAEVLFPFPERIETIRSVRSTLLLSSFASIRDAGHEEAYRSSLRKDLAAAVIDSVAGMWLPVEVGIAHYAACDALRLAPEREVEIGRGVGNKIRGTLLGTVVRMAKGAGLTPSAVIPQFPRFWSRAFEGGGMGATIAGPKEILLSVQKVPFAEYHYFRNALRGVAMGVLDLFCTKVYMTETKAPRAEGTICFRVQWA
jgi:hypothetical protein